MFLGKYNVSTKMIMNFNPLTPVPVNENGLSEHILEDFRGPRKTVFCLKITSSKSAGNHGALQPKTTNFPKLLLWHFKKIDVRVTSE